MNLACGIIGLPNAGKSTLFNALLKKQVAFATNFPFATIEPNVGVVPVPDERLEKLARVVSNSQLTTHNLQPPIVPATVKFIDIAGLVAGAHKGEGLGNKFLAHIREVDLICMVLRTFSDPDVVHVSGAVDPQRDQETLEAELILADLQTLENQKSKIKDQNDKEKIKNGALIKLTAELNSGRLAKDVELTDQEKEAVRELHLLTMKPVLYVLNVGESDISRQSSVVRQDDEVIISAKIEAELAGLTETEQKEYLKTLGLEKSGLERLIQKVYAKLNLISFLTAGEKEVRAWTIKSGTRALQAAGVIHTDFEKCFIKAEVVTYDDFVAVGGWTKAREVGKVRFEGKNYLMRDGDVVEFKVNA